MSTESVEAFKRIKARGFDRSKRGQIYAILPEKGDIMGAGLTHNEIAVLLNEGKGSAGHRNNVQARMIEMVQLGLAKLAYPKTCPYSQMAVRTWIKGESLPGEKKLAKKLSRKQLEARLAWFEKNFGPYPQEIS